MQLRWIHWGALALPLAMMCACGDDGGTNPGDGDAGNNGGNDGGAVPGEVRVDSLSPDHGPLAGGTIVTVSGAGFVLNMAGDAMVLVGGQLAAEVSVVDDSTITVTVPAGVDPGDVDVTVFNANGFITVGGAYSYNPLPTLSAVDPPMADAVGGTTVTLTGTGFSNLEPGTNEVMVGGAAGTNVNVNSDTELTVDVPAGEPFTIADIVVTNDNGTTGTTPLRYFADGLLATTSGFGPSRGRIFFVDPDDGTVRFLADVLHNNVRTPVTGMEVVGTTIYAVTGFDFTGPRSLLTVDPWTGETTFVGPLMDPNGGGNPQGGLPGEVVCRDIAYLNGTMYCNSQDSLYTVNLADAECTLIGSTGGWRSGRGTATDGVTMYEVADNQLQTVDPLTGATTPITGVPALGTINALSYVGGIYYASDNLGGGKGGGGNNDSRIVVLDVTNGALTEVAYGTEIMWDAVIGTPAY